jgi:DNA-binding MarR family transcriptional regulator
MPDNKTEDTTADLAALQSGVVAFVRGFGLHHPELTPCGVAISVSQAHAITELGDGDGLTQSELGSRLRLSKSTVSRLVGQLQERGWVHRDKGHPDDGRVVQLRLTEAGLRIHHRLARARRDRMAELLERIPETERQTVLHALKLLTEATGD